MSSSILKQSNSTVFWRVDGVKGQGDGDGSERPLLHHTANYNYRRKSRPFPDSVTWPYLVKRFPGSEWRETDKVSILSELCRESHTWRFNVYILINILN